MRNITPSFTVEIPLVADMHAQSVLKKRFFAAKQQYNAILGEALKRLTKMRADKLFLQAKQLYNSNKKEDTATAKEIFKNLEKAYGYRKYDLYAYTKIFNKKGSGLSIGARISQQIAKKVFSAVEEYRKGKRGKPRFKGYRGIHSIEDNSIDSNLRLKGDTLHYLGLKLPLMYNPKDPIHYHGFNSHIKYVRLVRRVFNGRTRYYAQLICEGKPWIKSKNSAKEGILGLDIGPQTIAAVSTTSGYASLGIFADELSQLKQKKKRLQQKLSRQLRANNPEAFEKDNWEKKDKQWKKKKGKSIKGKRLRVRSQSLKRTQTKIAEMQRKEAAFRKTQHGKLANILLRIGKYIKTEKLSYKAFQKLFGKSVGLRAPGMFLEILKRKAENAGGKVEEINTWKTKLSQTCHCGRQEKKQLKVRWHRCVCGAEAQRDLYSAFLACFVEKNKLMADQAQEAWSGMDIVLCAAMKCIKQPISGSMPASLGLSG